MQAQPPKKRYAVWSLTTDQMNCSDNFPDCLSGGFDKLTSLDLEHRGFKDQTTTLLHPANALILRSR